MLLNLGHSKVEAAALGEIKLLNLDHKKYDPYKIVGNHQVNCNLKAYKHEQEGRIKKAQREFQKRPKSLHGK